MADRNRPVHGAMHALWQVHEERCAAIAEAIRRGDLDGAEEMAESLREMEGRYPFLPRLTEALRGGQ